MTNAGTMLAYAALTAIGLFLLSQLAVDVLLRSVKRSLRSSSLWSKIEMEEPATWWRKVKYFIGLEKQVPDTVARRIRSLGLLFASSKLLLGTSVVVFVLANFLR